MTQADRPAARLACLLASWKCPSTHGQRHIVHVHIRVVRATAGTFVIEEADADGLPGIGREVERHLYPDAVVGSVDEELLQDVAAAVHYVGLLPAIRA